MHGISTTKLLTLLWRLDEKIRENLAELTEKSDEQERAKMRADELLAKKDELSETAKSIKAEYLRGAITDKEAKAQLISIMESMKKCQELAFKIKEHYLVAMDSIDDISFRLNTLGELVLAAISRVKHFEQILEEQMSSFDALWPGTLACGVEAAVEIFERGAVSNAELDDMISGLRRILSENF